MDIFYLFLEDLCVWAVYVDTLGVLARTLAEHFRPIAVDCLQLGLSLVSNTADPDVRRSMLVLILLLIIDRVAGEIIHLVVCVCVRLFVCRCSPV